MAAASTVAPPPPTTPGHARSGASPPRTSTNSIQAGRLAYTDYAKQIDRTKAGLLFFAIGALVSWAPLPFIGLIGGLLTLIGAILVVLGRRAFGSRHAVLVVVSVVIVFSTLVTGLILGAAIGVRIGLAAQSQDPVGLRDAFLALFYVVIILAAFGGVANVLFVHELEDRVGKVLLYAGFALALGVSILAVSRAADSLATLGSSITPEDILAISQALSVYQLLQGIPGVVFAAAYLVARARISRGDIPKRDVPTQDVPPRPWSGTHVPPPGPATAPASPSVPDRPGPPPEF